MDENPQKPVTGQFPITRIARHWQDLSVLIRKRLQFRVPRLGRRLDRGFILIKES